MKYSSRQRFLGAVRPTTDWLLSAAGPNSFAQWHALSGHLLASRNPRMRRVGRSLITAPTPPGHYIPVSIGDAKFKYIGSKDDDLSYVARFNFMPYEIVTRILWTELCRSATFVVDIGASTGAYSLTALASNTKIRVLAVEPNPRMLVLLLSNVDVNDWLDRCCVLGVASSDASAMVELGLNDAAGGAGLVSLEKPLIGHGHALVATLNIGPLIESVQVIKIDVEGYEPTVLSGIVDVLKRDHPVIISEALSDSDLKRQRAVLDPLGYGEPLSVSREYDYTGDSRNFVWSPRGQFDSVAETLEVARTKAEEHLADWRRLFPDVVHQERAETLF